MPIAERPDPPYLQVVRYIRDQIVAGHLKNGDAIPSARQIVRDWDVSLATATKALTTLRTEGLVVGKPGSGTVVQTRVPLHQSAKDRSISIARTGKIYPPGHYAVIHDPGLTQAPDHVADALGIAAGAPVIHRRRVTYNADGAPISTSVSWFDGALAADAPLLLQTERIRQGTVRYAAEQTGRILARTYEQVAASDATEEVAGALQVEPGSPVLIGQNRYVDSQGDVIEYGESAAPRNYWVFFEYSTQEEEVAR